MYQIWRIYLDLWGHDCKKWVWPTFGCKLGQNDPIVMQLKLDMSCHLLNVYTKFQIDISKHVEEKSGKRGRTDGRTDGWTLPRHNTSRFSNGRIKMRFIIHYVKPTAQLLFKIRFPKGGPTCWRQVVNPGHQTPQGQSVAKPETPLQNIQVE